MLWSAVARNRQNARPASDRERSRVTWSAGAISLCDPALFADPGSSACRLFLQRIFRLDEVRAVEVDRSRGTARIDHESRGRTVDETLDRLAVALRGGQTSAGIPIVGALPAREGSWTAVRVVRRGMSLTTWDVVHASAGRVRLRNEVLRTDEGLAHRIVRELSAVHGVESCHVRCLTASLLVRFDPTDIDTQQLVQILDHLLQGSAQLLGHAGDPPPTSFALANTAVGLAALGEFVLPALLPASALLLVGSNLKTFRAAWDKLRRRQPGLPLLYTTIVVVTLSSGQFLAAALMAWMVKFWHRQHRDRLLATRRRLLPGIAQHRRLARLASGEGADVLLEELRPGDMVQISAGAVIPADGRVVEGSALVDEGLLCGRDGL
ncbi:MAG: hypothetical protein P4L84_37515, partial [Isosphaeraceae bacterium]|nr:hypothetical protein [Isosphaeraceae bacterium]